MNPADEVQRLLDKLSRTIEDLRQTINDTLARIPGWLAWVRDRILDAWNWMCGKLSEFWTYIQELWAMKGDPDAISATADSWQNLVGGPVATRAAMADGGSLRADDMWSGTAADQYRQILPLQKGAMTAIKTMTNDISSALATMRVGILVFWVAVGVGVAAFIGAVAGAIVTAMTVAGATFSPGIVVGGLIVLIAAIGAGVMNLQAQASSANSALVRVVNEGPAFPAGAWPKGAL